MKEKEKTQEKWKLRLHVGKSVANNWKAWNEKKCQM